MMKQNGLENNSVHEGDDETMDDFEIEDAEAQLDDTLQKVRKDLKACREERQEYLDGWQRAQADMLNLKKRTTLELAKEKEKATVTYIQKLLPVCDSFSMALADDAWNDAPESWKKGIEQTHDQLLQIMKEYDVKEVGEIGEAFDPNIHEAISVENAGDNVPAEDVIKVLQKGYKMGDHLIRPARVIISN